MVSNAPPTNFKSNHVPDSHALKLVRSAPHTPPTCLSLNTLPQSRPIPIKSSTAGIDTAIASKIRTLHVNPSKRAAAQHTAICAAASGTSGAVQPRIKWGAVIGEVNNRSMKAPVRSFAINIPEKREIKDKPNTAIPGANCSISNKSTGIFD